MHAGPEKTLRETRWQRFLSESSFLRHYIWKYRKLVGIGLLALIVVDILEIIPPLLLKVAVDAALGNEPRALLLNIALAYVGVALLQAICRYGWRMYLIRSSMLAGRDLRQRFARHLFGLSASFFDRRPVGQLMSLATSDVESVRQAAGPGLLVFADALFYFITVPAAMFWLSPKLALLAFLPLPVIPWLVARNERAIHDRYEKVQECFAELSAMAQESLNGVRVTKAYAQEHAQIGRFRAKGREFVSLSLRLARVQTAFGPTLDFAMSIGMVALLFVGGRLMLQGDDPALTLGVFVAFQRYIQKMVWPMAALGMALSHYQRAVTSSGRLKEVLACRTDVPDVAATALPAGHPGLAAGGAPLAPWRTQGAVEFRDLSFRFPGADREALRGISARIEPGERVAFVGAVGSGKSALLSLLPRVYPVANGMLFVDGVDVNRWPLEELRRQVGYVSQEVFLFSETVTENIAFGLGDWKGQTTQIAEIEAATRLAGVHDDVVGLASSFRTRVGERGVSLSGGQKQRLTIARALIKKPPILLLDDALSSVDVQTEEKILDALRQRPGRNTEIIAAHRISTILDSDRIIVLQHGQIVQQGTHRQLITGRGGLYWRFYEQQRLQEDLEQYSEKLDHVLTGGEK